ncbi:MAG: hypothetical protein L0Y72_00255 [Gemmataceae bacterium]|nr:hypothetical protein [Gemmataceae bacterium]MCI0737441.1 hypothetical protein [Gemmataceae bacterium]
MNRIFLCLGTVFLSIGLLRGQEPPAKQKQETKPKPRLTITKETTFVTDPLDKDGYPDYAAALNARLRQGVTPKNNANVSLFKVFGPKPEGARLPPKFYEWLGVAEPPEKGDYYVPLFRYLRDDLKIEDEDLRNVIDEEADRARERPWKANKYGHVAAWLEANEKPLATLVEGMRRSHYYLPLVPSSNQGLITTLLPSVQKCRELIRALTARAMLHTGEGRYDAAWQDLLTGHRLARHVAKGGTIIEGLVGVAIEAINYNSILAFLDGAKLSSKQLQACLRDLRALPPLLAVADKMDGFERFMLLETIVQLERGDMSLDAVLNIAPPRDFPEEVVKEFLKDVSWDAALRTANRWYDQVSAAMRSKDRGAREKKLSELSEELQTNMQSVLDPKNRAKILAEKPDFKGKIFGDTMFWLLLGGVHKVQIAGDRAEQGERNLHLAFALAAYQRDQGAYPKKLEALVPKYLPAIPLDHFTGNALVYRPAETGYLLYSFGPNGLDEQGRYYDDNPPGDDPRVRMPLPKADKK